MVEKFEQLEQRVIRTSNILEYCEYKMRTPDGRIVTYDIMRHKGASAVVPVTDDGKILMVRQYRPSIDQISLEIPAGCRDSEEEPFRTAAIRELEEETGYRAETVEHLITITTAIAYCDEKIEVYVAKGLKPTAQRLDDDEFIDCVPCDVGELKRMIYSSEITDSKTIAAVMAYAQRL